MTTNEIEQVLSLSPGDEKRWEVVKQLAKQRGVPDDHVWCAYCDALMDGRANNQRWH